jgi:hypothetical protein
MPRIPRDLSVLKAQEQLRNAWRVRVQRIAFRFATVSGRYAAEDKRACNAQCAVAETNPIRSFQLAFRDLWRHARHYEIDPTIVPCVPWLQEIALISIAFDVRDYEIGETVFLVNVTTE